MIPENPGRQGTGGVKVKDKDENYKKNFPDGVVMRWKNAQ